MCWGRGGGIVQRPLEEIARLTGDCFIPRGVNVPALSRELKWPFKPSSIKVGDPVTGGDIYAVRASCQTTSSLSHGGGVEDGRVTLCGTLG
jgi:vacuolar-type H+-ATPase catalytic subunit A/Vma1